MAEHAAFTIPTRRGERTAVLIMVGVITFFAAVAVFNLATWPTTGWWGMALSVLWLLIVGLWIVVGCRESGGWKQGVIEFASQFSRRRHALIESDGDQVVVRLIFSLLRHRFTLLRVRRDGIMRVSWGTGQGSYWAGRDVNDWQVALWFKRGAALTPRSPHGTDPDDLVLIGPAQCHNKTEALGQAFVAYLQSAGIQLVPSRDHHGRMVYESST